MNDNIAKAFADLDVADQAKVLNTLGKAHAKAGGAPFAKADPKLKVSSRTPPFAFVKWPGGKRKVFPRILPLVPENIKTYYEPFVGGGSVFFELQKRGLIEKAVLADDNADLILAYEVIRDDVEGLIQLLLTDSRFKYGRDEFLAARKWEPEVKLERAARFVYLMKACFNGLYRVNSKGKFNAPFGKPSNPNKPPTVVDAVNLRAVSKALQGVTLKCCKFEEAVKGAKKGDFIYFDPPYAPVSTTSKFTNYTTGGFKEKDHRNLAKLFARLIERGIPCVLSNSIAPLVYEIYPAERFQIIEFTGARNIGGPVAFRKPAGEVLIAGKELAGNVAPSV